MKKIVVLDWDREEFRFVVGGVRRRKVELLGAGAVPWSVSEEAAPLSSIDQGQQIREHLKPFKVGKGPVVVLGNRSQVEEFHLSLPPCGDVDLPQLVLNQTILESPGLTEEAILDFAPDRPVSAEDPRKIVAFVLNPGEMQSIRAICQQGGLTLTSIQYRPYAATVVLQQQLSETLETISLLVTLYRSEVELAVVEGDRVHLSRQFRLPNSISEELLRTRLVGEIRRTLLIAPQHLGGGQQIADVRLQGTSEVVASLVVPLQQELALPVLVTNPLEVSEVHTALQKVDEQGLSPMIGALVLECQDRKPVIDFLNPHRPVERKSQVRSLVLAALLVCVGGYFGYDYFQQQAARANAPLLELNRTNTDLKAKLKKIEKERKLAEALDQWERSSPNWLEELRDLSLKMPAGEEVTLSRLTLSPGRGGGGVISFTAAARTPESVVALEKALRDSRHGVQTPGITQRGDKNYPWGFESTVTIIPAEEAEERGVEDLNPTPAKKTDPNPVSSPVEPSREKADPESGKPSRGEVQP